ncbi:MAG: hypothetical protein WBI14_01275 [Anaerolineaceae bacterium]
METAISPAFYLNPSLPGLVAQKGLVFPWERASFQEAVRDTRVDFLRELREVSRFSEALGSVRLRRYQKEVATAVVRSILEEKGLSFVVIFPRQSGKNLLQAQLEVYLMAMLAERGAEMVKFSPTYQPQSLNAMRRLESALEANLLTRGHWRKSAGNHYRFRNAHLTFLSAAPGSNVVGATASTLLQLDEAQDIEIGKYDKQIAPMAASTNATRVFWGTAWTDQTLLAREMQAAQVAEARDGQRRVFVLGAEAVRAEVPAYGQFVDDQVARLGRNHPFVRSQFFSETVNFESSLFNAARLGLMRGSHDTLETPQAGKRYAMLVDLAGEDEAKRDSSYAGDGDAAGLSNVNRDSTAVTIVEIDLELFSDTLIEKPRYRVVRRELWTGERHASQFGRLLALAERWQIEKIVIDASGVGAGVASLLKDKLGERVIALTFSAQVKSRLGWGFLATIDTGRFEDFRSPVQSDPETPSNPLTQVMQSEQDRLQALFYRQLAGLKSVVSIGPERLLKWSVPEGTRDPEGGQLHDDLVLSAAMVAVLDEQTWSVRLEPTLILAPDPLEEMNGGY